jgi:tRNA-modifying protein YgfZ
MIERDRSTTPLVAPEPDPVETLLSGDGFVDLSWWRKVGVTGSDALRWLNDLVSADISGLGANEARRSLLLSPTGRIRAEFMVTRFDGAILLIQDPAQPNAIDDLLGRYVLSSDVELRDRTSDVALFAFPGRPSAPAVHGATSSAPSCLGAGVDLLVPAADHETTLGVLARTCVLAGNEDVERWRVIAGIPRFGVDGTEEDLPAEGGLDDAVSYGKGCYLGQEAVAKVRNLGHPRRALAHLTARQAVSAGDPVFAGGEEIGRVTSAADHEGRWFALAQVRWDARDAPSLSAAAVPLSAIAIV